MTNTLGILYWQTGDQLRQSMADVGTVSFPEGQQEERKGAFQSYFWISEDQTKPMLRDCILGVLIVTSGMRRDDINGRGWYDEFGPVMLDKDLESKTEFHFLNHHWKIVLMKAI